MALVVLKAMVKEEWRVHSKMFGGINFALFPVMLAAFSFLGSLMLPALQAIYSLGRMISVFHLIYLLFGVSVGSFGLFGREIMNRRFGQASMITYSSRTLPLSEKEIFANFFVKDIIFYFFLWVLPPILGLAIASPLLGISSYHVGLLLLTATLSFLLGLSVVFFLSTVYVHSRKALLAVLAGILGLAALLIRYSTSPLELFTPLSIFYSPSPQKVLVTLAAIILLSAVSINFLKVDYPDKRRRFNNSLSPLTKIMPFGQYSHLIAKDFLDMRRSEGGIAKLVFSLLIPLGLVWAILQTLTGFMPGINFLYIFAVFFGAISSTIYNWLTEFDLFTSYGFFPLKQSDLIKSKVRGFMVLDLLCIIVLWLAGAILGYSSYLPLATLVFLATSFYSLSVTIRVAGLQPNILLYNAKVFLSYSLLTCPILVTLIFLPLFSQYLLLLSALLFPLGHSFLQKSYQKWDSAETMSY
ncbi:MAG: hypothetical protein JW727_05425 [Candidatus Aenigmarchaeota archaeon]|nr:hypothetical protein [Candidatus Aenigmarchaeota archaeon]